MPELIDDSVKMLLSSYQTKRLHGIPVPKNWSDLSVEQQMKYVLQQMEEAAHHLSVLLQWSIDLKNGKKIK